MNDSQDALQGTSHTAEARHLARLDRLLRTAARARSLAERIETGCETSRRRALADEWQTGIASLQADAGELKSLADDLVLLGYTFREAPLAPVLQTLQEWLRELGGRDQVLQLDIGGTLQIDQRLIPVLRERMQDLIVLLLELTAAQRRSGGEAGVTAHLRCEASVRGRSLAVSLTCDELELGAADLVRAARTGGFMRESPEALLRFPGRLIFSPSFAAGWGLPAQWQERLLRLRDRLRGHRGDLQLREGNGGQWSFSLQLPLSADLAAVLVVRSGGEMFALPIEAVFSTRRVAPAEWRHEAGMLWVDQAAPEAVEGLAFTDWMTAGPAMAAELSGLLEDGPAPAMLVSETAVACVLLEDADGMVALIVDEILGERQVLLRHPRQLLRRVSCLMGSFLLPSEEICVVLHPWDLLQRARRRDGPER